MAGMATVLFKHSVRRPGCHPQLTGLMSVAFASAGADVQPPRMRLTGNRVTSFNRMPQHRHKAWSYIDILTNRSANRQNLE